MVPREIRAFLLAFVLMSAGGLLLHLRLHAPTANVLNWVPPLFGLLNLLVLPVLFSRGATAPLALVLTWVTVAAGTLGMAYFSLTHWDVPLTPKTFLLNSTLPDILILWTKLPLAAWMHDRVRLAPAPGFEPGCPE